MIVTDQFVFLHLLRSGGTFISEVIKKFFPSAREIGYHLPRAALPKEFDHLPILGSVRSPWEFYVSWYHHHLPNPKHLPLYSTVSENRQLDCAATIRNALDLSVVDDKLDLIIQQLPDGFDYRQRHIANMTKAAMGKIRGTGIGLYTFRFNEIFGRADDVHFCRVESLRSDLMRFFESVGVATDELRNHVLQLEKKNASEHRHWSSYYTTELAELVATRDRPLIERFGFAFDTSSLK